VPSSTARSLPSAPRRCILVVDDDLHVAEAICRELQPYYHVVQADRAAVVNGTFDEVSPDLVILDFRRPDDDVHALMEEIRRRRPALPIILMSSIFDARAAEAMVFGVGDFVARPFDGEALVAKIERQLAARDQRIATDELYDRRDTEAAVANTVLARMMSRGVFDTSLVRYLVRASDQFSGDVVFGAAVEGDRYRWLVGDVTGHTLASALVTIPLSMMFYSTAAQGVPLAQAIAMMDRELCALLPANMFCAATVCELDRRSGTLELWNGGMPDVLIRHPGGAVARLGSNDAPLAADRRRTVPFELMAVALAPGARIYALSDGMVESRDWAEEMLGVTPLAETLAAVHGEEAFDALMARWAIHVGDGAVDDDISMIEVIV
jgi:two-component system, HptB-dependent secretion and biofilm response regulator